MKYLVTGGGGQLAHVFHNVCSDLIVFNYPELDIRNKESIKQKLIGGDCIVNTAAISRPDIAEADPEIAFSINGFSLYNLAKHAHGMGVPLVHISTDYVFDGITGNYREDDQPNPKNTYGLSKMIGESIVRLYAPQHYIVRTSALFGPLPQGGSNFVTRLQEKLENDEQVAVVDDQFTSPTYTVDLVKAIRELVETNAPYGTYHLVSAGGGVSWYSFAKGVGRLINREAQVIPCVTQDTLSIYRPKYSTLIDTKTNFSGGILRQWKDCLIEYFNIDTDNTILCKSQF